MPVYVDEEAATAAALRRRERQREASKRYREKHPERVKENSRKQYAKNPERRMLSHKKWLRDKGQNPVQHEKIKALYRKNHAERRECLNPPACCEGCGAETKVYFDHCHIKMKFRGWLCNSCNLILGHAKDNPERLRNLALYLEREI